MQSGAARSASPSHGDRPSNSQYASAQAITGPDVDHPSGARPVSSEPMVTNSSQSVGVGHGDGITSAGRVADVDGSSALVAVGDIDPSARWDARHPRKATAQTRRALIGTARQTSRPQPARQAAERSVTHERFRGPSPFTQCAPVPDTPPPLTARSSRWPYDATSTCGVRVRATARPTGACPRSGYVLRGITRNPGPSPMASTPR